jgi:polyferredoxin
MYALLADLVVFIHALFVLFVVIGQALILIGWFVGWRWTRYLVFRVAHLAAIVFVVVEAWFGIVCPLTTLGNELSIWAGQEGNEMSFIGYWLDRMLFYTAPEWVFTLVYTLFALLVVTTFVFYPPNRKRKL